MKRFLLLAVIVLLTAAVTLWVAPKLQGVAWPWQSREARLAEACKRLAFDDLVAPSTAVMESYSFVPHGEPSPRVDFRLRSIARLEEAIEEVTPGLERATADLANLLAMKKDLEERAAAEGRAPLRAAEVRRIETAIEGVQAGLSRIESGVQQDRHMLAEFRREQAEYEAGQLWELKLVFDTQNRAGAMLRMHAICTFKPLADTTEAAASMVLFDIADGRG